VRLVLWLEQDTLRMVYHSFSIPLLIAGYSFGEIPHSVTVISNKKENYYSVENFSKYKIFYH
jgi:hypothetical protein